LYYIHIQKIPMIVTSNKPLSEWDTVLQYEDLSAAILDRVLERGRFIHLDGPSGRTRHLNLEEILPAVAERARISGIRVPEFPEPTEGICDRGWWLRFYGKSVEIERYRGIAVVQLGSGIER